MSRSSRNQDMTGTNNANPTSSSQPSSRKRKHCHINPDEPSESRKRHTALRAVTERGRSSRDGSQPGPSRSQTQAPDPTPDLSSCILHTKAASELHSCGGSCCMPLLMSGNGSINRSGSTNLHHILPSVPSLSSRHGEQMNQNIPMFTDCQMPTALNTRQNSLRQSASVGFGRTPSGPLTAMLQASLPLPLPRFNPDRNSHTRCSICYPPRTFPPALVNYPLTEVPAVSQGVDTQVPAPHAGAVYAVNRSSHTSQSHRTHPHRVPEAMMRGNSHGLMGASRSHLPNLLALSQFSANTLYSDINSNHIPAPPRIPFREIEPFSAAMRSTRSVTNRPLPLSNFTEAMSRFNESWAERYPGADVEGTFLLMPRHVSPNFHLLPSFDAQNYEALLGLAQQLAEAKPKGLSKSELDQLVIFHYNSDANRSDVTNCVVCMSDFENRQRIRVLRCRHQFHSKCVDKWLKTNRTCPMCRSDAMETKKTPKKKKSREN